MIRIVVIAEHQTEEERISRIVASHYAFEFLGSGKDSYDAIRMIKTLKPDIALLDEHLPLIGTADIIPTIKAQSPKTGIIILTDYPEGEYNLKAIRNGSSGYVTKKGNPERLLEGIKMVHRHGGSLMNSEIVAKAFLEPPGSRSVPGFQRAKLTFPANISRKELRLISYIGQGLSNKEIAKILRLKDGTIRNYVSSIFHKTGLRNRTEVAIFAHKMGLKGTQRLSLIS